ncbi:hypothetical protein TNCV_923641 [Trichonephila clavipes]|nr:hypothetical protein TNCV_923641 [Trichonephila clavipes]
MHVGVIGVHVVSKQDPPDGFMGNPNMTGDSPLTSNGIVLYHIQHSQLIVFSVFTLRSRSCVPMMKNPLSDNIWWMCAKKLWLGVCLLG